MTFNVIVGRRRRRHHHHKALIRRHLTKLGVAMQLTYMYTQTLV